MLDNTILLPSKPRTVSETENKGVFEIDNLYPGYGHTLGNSLRRIILSSLPGFAITSVKIDGVSHEFATIEGIKEDIITLILNLRRVRFLMTGTQKETLTLSVKGPKVVTANDISATGQVEVINKNEYICEITGKKDFSMEITIESGLGFVSRDEHHRDKVDIGTIALDAVFTPVRRVSYDVENMRVGDRTNHNRLRITIETDGSITAREALDTSIRIMIDQLDAMLETSTQRILQSSVEGAKEDVVAQEKKDGNENDMVDTMKTRIDTLDFSSRTLNALVNAGIRTLGGLARKKEEDLLELEGMGEKGISEIKKIINEYGIVLK
ncbi:MAG: DNA-directed RNA polymerase subunit alpha [Candidatus Pacebacteria bacterium]|nr:DNA-directed RNA polymerase subunit alpha [Candidatus Paceibacterota bacterium]